MAVSGPRQPRRRPHRGSLVEAVPVAGRLARTAHPGDHRQPGRRRLPPVLGAVRDPPRRSRPPSQHVHPLHVVRRLSVHGPRQVRRRDDRRASAADGPERDPARRGRGGQAGDRSCRWERDRGRRCARRCAGDLHRRHRGGRGRSVEQRQVALAVGQRSTSQRPGQWLRPGRAQLHVPQLEGRGGAVQGAQRHRVPEDPRPQRLLPRGLSTTAGRSATFRWSASPTAGR